MGYLGKWCVTPPLGPTKTQGLEGKPRYWYGTQNNDFKTKVVLDRPFGPIEATDLAPSLPLEFHHFLPFHPNRGGRFGGGPGGTVVWHVGRRIWEQYGGPQWSEDISVSREGQSRLRMDWHFLLGGGALGAVDRAWADVQCRQGGHEGLGLAVAGEVQAGGVEARVVGVVHVEQQQLQQLGAEA